MPAPPREVRVFFPYGFEKRELQIHFWFLGGNDGVVLHTFIGRDMDIYI